jgi:tetratricopeptide (TPR) repeat protein
MKPSSRISFVALGALLACPVLLAQSSASSSRSADAYHEPTPRESMREAFKNANEDYAAGHYDDAIAGYDRALSIDPSQYAIWTSRAMALRMRGTSTFNKALAAKDEAGKTEAKKDFLAAAESANKAVILILTEPTPTGEQARTNLVQAHISALSEKGASLEIIGERFNDSMAMTNAIAAYKDAVDLTTNTQKKNQLRNKEGAVLSFKADFASALAIYKTVLDSDPVNMDALLNAFLACVGLPEMDVKGAREYGTRFLKAAPANDPHRKDVQDVLDALPKT